MTTFLLVLLYLVVGTLFTKYAFPHHEDIPSIFLIAVWPGVLAVIVGMFILFGIGWIFWMLEIGVNKLIGRKAKPLDSAWTED